MPGDVISGWRGLYVEWSPDGGFFMLWDAVGFLGAVRNAQDIADAVRGARKGSPVLPKRTDAHPKKRFTPQEERAMIDDWIKAHPDIRVPIRKEDALKPGVEAASNRKRRLLTMVRNMSAAQRTELLSALEKGEDGL